MKDRSVCLTIKKIIMRICINGIEAPICIMSAMPALIIYKRFELNKMTTIKIQCTKVTELL